MSHDRLLLGLRLRLPLPGRDRFLHDRPSSRRRVPGGPFRRRGPCRREFAARAFRERPATISSGGVTTSTDIRAITGRATGGACPAPRFTVANTAAASLVAESAARSAAPGDGNRPRRVRRRRPGRAGGARPPGSPLRGLHSTGVMYRPASAAAPAGTVRGARHGAPRTDAGEYARVRAPESWAREHASKLTVT